VPRRSAANCQGVVSEFHIVWRVVTLIFLNWGFHVLLCFLLSLLLLAASEAYIIGDKCLSGCRLTFLYSFLWFWRKSAHVFYVPICTKLFTILILDFWEFKKQLNQQLCYLGQRALSTLCLKKTVHFCFVRTSSNFHELLIVLVDRWKSGWNYMVYKYFPPNLTHVTSLPCESRSNLLHNVEMYHLQQTMWRRN